MHCNSAVKRVPLNVVVTETSRITEGVLVAVMVADLDALEAENAELSKRLVVTRTALTEIAHKNPESWVEQVARKALEA